MVKLILTDFGLTERVWYLELFADANGSRVLDFTMPGNRGRPLIDGIVVDAMFRAFAHQRATIGFQVPD